MGETIHSIWQADLNIDGKPHFPADLAQNDRGKRPLLCEREYSIGHGLEIERAHATFSAYSNRGLTVTPSASVSIYRDAIMSLAARYKLPAIYGFHRTSSTGA